MNKKQEVKKRHLFIINIAKIFIRPVIKFKYRYHFKYHKELKNTGPYLILGNHSLGIDPLLMSLSFPFHLYYFATEQIMNLGLLSKLLKFAANPIGITKGKTDMNSIRKARRIVSEGGSIGLFPEGNISYTGETNKIDISVVKLAKLLKIPIILFRFEGLFLTSSRWSVKNTKSFSKGSIHQIIQYDEYKNMNDDELYEVITKGLYVNAYNNIDIEYKGKDKALGLERLVFMDLKVNTPFVNFTKGDMLYSEVSDFTLKYDKFGYVTDDEGEKYNLIEANKRVINSYLNYYKNNVIDFNTKVMLFKNVNKRKTKLNSHDLRLTNNKIIVSRKGEELVFDFENIEQVAIQGKRQIILYLENDTYLIRFDEKTSPYMFLLTFQFYKKGEGLYDEFIDISKFGL